MAKLSVGLVGYGLAGRYLHRPLITAAGMDIVAVVSRQTELLQAELPAARVVSSIEALLEIKPLDLVVIASPNRWHYAHAMLALNAGKHVVVDKPMAPSSAEARDLGEAATRLERKLAVFHNRRWDSDFLTLQKLLAEGVLGEPLSFRARWDRYRPDVAVRWRERNEAGAGILYDLGSHLIDQALCLFGAPEWLQAQLYTQRPGAVVDDGFEILMGRGNLRVSLGASSVAAEHAFRYQLDGVTGSFTKSGLDPQAGQLELGMRPSNPKFGVEPHTQWGSLTDGATGVRAHLEPQRGTWPVFYQQMRRAIETDAAVPVAAADAARVLQIIEAARLSSDERRGISLQLT
jgi:scyllo-inositol 2-dehydrogenase (NADP+)